MSASFDVPIPELNEDELEEYLEPFERKVFLLIGHGSAGFKNLHTVLREADSIASRFDCVYGKGEWLVVFGGDPPSSKRPSIGNVAKHLATHRGVPVLAVQKRVYRESTLKGEGGVDHSCSAVTWYQDDPYDPKKIGPYGGTDAAGRLVGASRIYLGETVLPHLAGVIALGGGPVSLSEAKYATRVGLPLRYVRCPALVTKRGGPCGAIDEWATQMQQACKQAGKGRSGLDSKGPSAGAATGASASASGSESAPAPAPLVRAISDGLRGTDSWPRWAKPEDGICMTMHQPWASLMVRGLKRAEGREWNTGFRGTLWIHAGGHPPAPHDVAQVQAQYAAVYAHAIPPELPAGKEGAPEGDGEAESVSAAADASSSSSLSSSSLATREGLLDAAVRRVTLPVPAVYPTSCLIGTVDIVDVVPREKYRAMEGSVPPSVLVESGSGFVFLCERPHVLSVPVSMRGKGKLWKLPRKVAKEASKGLVRAHGPEPFAFASADRAVAAAAGGGEEARPAAGRVLGAKGRPGRSLRTGM